MSKTKKLALGGLLLAAGLTLPFLTGQIPQIGATLLPMHFPVMLGGFILGRRYGLALGLITPLLRSFIFSAPPPYPTALSMAFELGAYGLACALIWARSKKNVGGVYVSLIGAMLCGRAVWGLSRWLMTAYGTEFSLNAFMAGAFINALPGIALQLILIPALVLALKRGKLID